MPLTQPPEKENCLLKRMDVIIPAEAVERQREFEEKILALHAGATPLAAVLSGKLDVKDQRVVCVMSGGNIDVSFVQSIIERGLVARYRRIKFTATLLDKPGSLVQLLNVIADAGANILTVEHDKLNLRLNPNETNVHIACEVGGKDHGVNLIAKLRRMGYRIDLD